MTPGQRDPRPSGFGPLDHALAPFWVIACLDELADAARAEAGKVAAGAAMLAGWWAVASVVSAGWTLAAVVMGAEAIARAAQEPPGARPAPKRPRDARQPYRRLWGLAAALLPLSLAACPLLSGGLDTAAGGPPRTAAAEPPTIPTTTVPNPFWCPRRASP